MIQFTKMHGLGNDYIYVNTDLYPIANPAEFSIKWSKPHTGIGSDGLIMISRSEVADFQMRIFNADGTEALMCGNGSRCVGKYVYDHHLTDKTSITLDTLSGIKHITLLPDSEGVVKRAVVDMGKALTRNELQVNTPTGDLSQTPVLVDGKEFRATYVCMGNPHVVIFVDDITQIEVDKIGPKIEFDPLFPERTNVEFVEVRQDDVLRMRVWERGSGITQACGTGACATAVAAFLTGRAGCFSKVLMDGGELEITYDEVNGHVLMTGPAETSFEGVINE
ncbi:MAG: diaminopimelate epimerase [Bacteroidaceae bacterium]|nr:diaminopimelate epimerase [Bacteroidaceae bacterium]